MFFAFLLIFITSIGGLAITYFYDDDAPLMVRCAAGAVLGNVIVGLLSFLLALRLGFNVKSIGIATVFSGLPAIAFFYKHYWEHLQIDFANFKSKQQEFWHHFNLSKLPLVFAYTGLIVMLWFFFERALLDVRGGIGTGSANNIGDLPFHLAVIYGFVWGKNIPPENPIYSGVTFSYPYMTDFITAILNKLGASIPNAMFCQNMILSVALIILLARFTYKLTNNTFAAFLSPFLLLFNGGLGFLIFLHDAIRSETGVFGQLFNLSVDYTIRGGSIWRWGNSLTALFMTQRSLLFGLPLALIVLTKIWDVFTSVNENTNNEERLDGKFKTDVIISSFQVSLLITGLIAGTLPLIHAHSFAVVMGTAAALATMSWQKWRQWTVFFAAAALTAIPQLMLATMGSAARAESFIGWDFGWDNGESNPILFWFTNTGFFIPLLGAAVAGLVWISFQKTNEEKSEQTNQYNNFLINTFDVRRARNLLFFYAPFVLCFIVPNVVRLAPWVWDNIKVLIYWYVVSIPLVALVLAQLWQRSKITKFLVVGLIFTLMLSGWLDVWRVATRQYEYQIMPAAAVEIAAQIRARIRPRALILGAPEYDNVPVLTGRRWFLGYTGHVWSHGINSNERENIVRRIYAGAADADELIRENDIDYVLIGAVERRYASSGINEKFFQKYPVVAEAGEFRLYQVGD